MISSAVRSPTPLSPKMTSAQPPGPPASPAQAPHCRAAARAQQEQRSTRSGSKVGKRRLGLPVPLPDPVKPGSGKQKQHSHSKGNRRRSSQENYKDQDAEWAFHAPLLDNLPNWPIHPIRPPA